MKIHIFYSHYNIAGTDYKNRPQWFDYEKCFINLLETIKDNDNIKLNIVMDGKIEDNWIKKYKKLYNVYEFKGGSMEIITKAVYKIIKEYQCDSNDLIYILENDYLHVEGWVEKVLDMFQTFDGLHYVSLYDHGDKYWHLNYDDLVSKIFVSNTHHWRTMMSTCGSYIVSKKIFLEDYQDHITVVGDHNKWLYLNETKGRFLLTAVPGLSTHCMEAFLSPTINWAQINELKTI